MRERVQVRGPGVGPSIRPTAAPNIQTVSVASPRRSGASGLLASLAKLEPGLNAFLESERQAEIEAEATRAYDTIQGMTFDEARAAVEAGDLGSTETPWFEAAFKKQFGLRYAANRKREIAEAYETGFDRDNGDIEEFLTGFVNEDAAAFGGDKFVASGLREGMQGFLEKVRSTHGEYVAGRRQEAASQGFLDVAREAALTAFSRGEDVSAAVRALYPQHRQMLGVSFGEMDEMTISLAEELAEDGNFDAVKQLLETEVTGADGQKVGAFTARAKWSKKALGLVARAEAKWAENQRRELYWFDAELRGKVAQGNLTQADRTQIDRMVEAKVISPAQGASYLAQNNAALERAQIAAQNEAIAAAYLKQGTDLVYEGRGWAITDQTYTDASGKEQTLKASEIRQRAVVEAAQAMTEAGHGPATIANTLSSWAVEETVPQWENLLSNGHTAISTALTRAGESGEVVLPEAASSAYQLFKELGENPALRARHVKDSKALQVYMDAEVLERNGMTSEEALLMSSQVDRQRQRTGLTGRIGQDELRSAISEASNGGVLSTLGITSRAENTGYVSAQVEGMARIFVDLGLPMNKALDEAARRFSDSHMIIRGVAVNHRNRAVPAEFEDMAGFAIDEFASVNGEDPDDFSLMAGPTPRSWIIVDKNTGLPPALGANAAAFLTMSDITNRWQRVQDARNAKLRADANTGVVDEQKRRQEDEERLDRVLNFGADQIETPSDNL